MHWNVTAANAKPLTNSNEQRPAAIAQLISLNATYCLRPGVLNNKKWLSPQSKSKVGRVVFLAKVPNVQ